MKVKAFVEEARRAEAALVGEEGEPSEGEFGEPYNWAEEE
jgi:hypothetical protein